MKISAHVILTLMFCISVMYGYGQYDKSFRTLTINDGLSHTDAISLTQDNDGFIWIGTNAGLNRYDGRDVKLFWNDQSPLKQVYNNRITALLSDGPVIWVGSEGGISYFNREVLRYDSIEVMLGAEAFDVKPVKSIRKLGDNIWILAQNRLFTGRYDSISHRLELREVLNDLKIPESLKEAAVQSMTDDGNTNFWLGTNEGLYCLQFKNSKITFVENISRQSNRLKIRSNNINVVSYFNHRLWLLNNNLLEVLSLFQEDNRIRNNFKTIDLKQRIDASKFTLSPGFNDLLVDNSENCWISSLGGLLYLGEPLSDNGSMTIFRSSIYQPTSLQSNQISALFLDMSNCLWIGTWGGGASILDLEQKKFNRLLLDPSNPRHSLSGRFVRAITQDDNGNIWIGTRNDGLNCFNPVTGVCQQNYKGVDISKHLSSVEIRSLDAHEDKLYVGTQSGFNIVNLKNGAVRVFRPGDGDSLGLSNNAIFSVATDKFGTIWLGDWGGGINQLKLSKNGQYHVSRLNNDPQQKFHLSSNIVTFLFSDTVKNEILAGSSLGLNRIMLDKNGAIEKIVYYRGNNSPNSLSSEYIWPIIKQNDSIYWLGTLGGGLDRMVMTNDWDENGNASYRAEAFTVNDGASGNDVESLLMDNDGNLWLGGRGISRFDPKTKEFWNFDVFDGLQSNGFKIGSAYGCTDGTLYFGGINGLNYFNPRTIQKNTIKPLVAFTNLYIKNHEINPGEAFNDKVVINKTLNNIEKLNLDYTENDFSISFASLHFANPRKCSYRYKLEGNDTSWTYLTGEYPVATFSNLSYDNYKLLVDATNNDGIWSGSPRVLAIQITPPWWRSTLAFIVYGIIYIGLMILIFYSFSVWMKMKNNLRFAEIEERRKEELHQMKLQFFTNISHELKTPLTLIMTPIEKLIHGHVDTEEQNRLLKMISTNANQLFNLITELMDFRKAEAGKVKMHYQKQNLKNVVESIYSQFQSFAQEKGINFELKIDEDQAIWIDTEKVTKIINNLFSNALKFTKSGGNVQVKLFVSSPRMLGSKYANVAQINGDSKHSELLYMSVSDTGVGISKASIEHVFDRFYHIDSPEDNRLGSGIGLALVKSYMLLHNGHVMISSERGKGAEFFIGFPMGEDHLGEDELGRSDDSEFEDLVINELENFESDCQEQQNGSEKIEESDLPVMLILEDNLDLRQMMQDHFRTEFNVVEASNGEEGLDHIKARIPDIIISDIMMPVMDGFQFCRRVREDINTSHIPLIMLTAKSHVDSQIVGAEAGADLYITKPFSMRLLDVQLKRIRETRQHLREKYASDAFADHRDIAQNTKDKEFLDQFIEYIDQNMDNSEFTVDQLCTEMGIGRTNLYKKIRSLTGQSMGEFIRSLRLKKAARILSNEDVSVSEVIYRIGINSNSYFTKAFKAQFGVTPSEFIRRNEKTS